MKTPLTEDLSHYLLLLLKYYNPPISHVFWLLFEVFIIELKNTPSSPVSIFCTVLIFSTFSFALIKNHNNNGYYQCDNNWPT